jgi:hypothetical protein
LRHRWLEEENMRVIAMTLLCACVVASATPAAAQAARLQVVHDGDTLDGTCVLVHVDGRDTGPRLYFITSGRLFKTAKGDPLPPPRAVRITLEDGRTIAVPREGVVLPLGSLVDIAILRADVPAAALVPARLTVDAPRAGSVFQIAGYGYDGAPASVDEHVRFVSTRLVVGDRETSQLGGCVGAPAFAAASMFGIVSECEAGRAPVITVLSSAYPLIARTIPGLRVQPTLRNEP